MIKRENTIAPVAIIAAARIAVSPYFHPAYIRKIMHDRAVDHGIVFG